MRHVAHRVVIVNADPGLVQSFWLTRAGLPRAAGPRRHLGLRPPTARGSLDNGPWDRRHGDLWEASELDVGLRLVVA